MTDKKQVTENRRILQIAIPSIISNITVPLLGLIDVTIVGHLGSPAYIGAIAVGGMLFNIIYWIFGFLRMGTSGMTSQAYGQHDLNEITQLLLRSVGVGLLIAFCLLLLQYPILHLAFTFIKTTSEVEQLATTYFYICIWGAPATLGLYGFAGWFIGMQNSRFPMYIAITQNIVNIVASLCFVYLLDMQVAGVAAGTLIAQYAGFTGEDTEGQEGEAAALTVDFDALLAINPDFVGWLYSEGTVINYPVVQGEDNDYYLTHVFDGQEHKYGSIFLDKNTQADFTDTNTLIHGHRMNSGAMFGTLPEYAKQEYFEQHKVLMLYTPSKNYRLEVFAAYEVPANTQSVPLNFSDMAEYQEYLDAAAEKSLIRSDVSVSTEDQIVTLSTCTRTDSQKRFIVQAKLVPVS